MEREENILVAVRARPLSEGEVAANQVKDCRLFRGINDTFIVFWHNLDSLRKLHFFHLTLNKVWN
jgi:hypothetical protein